MMTTEDVIKKAVNRMFRDGYRLVDITGWLNRCHPKPGGWTNMETETLIVRADNSHIRIINEG